MTVMAVPTSDDLLPSAEITLSVAGIRAMSLGMKTPTKQTAPFFSSYYPAIVCRHTIEAKNDHHNNNNFKQLFHKKDAQLATQTSDATVISIIILSLKAH